MTVINTNMASTAIQNEEEKREYFDSPKELDQKVE